MTVHISFETNFIIKGINERYRTTALTIASMFNPDYVPPSADDEIMPPLSPTKTPKKIRKSIEPRSLSTSLNEAGNLIPPLEAIQHETLAGNTIINISINRWVCTLSHRKVKNIYRPFSFSLKFMYNVISATSCVIR